MLDFDAVRVSLLNRNRTKEHLQQNWRKPHLQNCLSFSTYIWLQGIDFVILILKTLSSNIGLQIYFSILIDLGLFIKKILGSNQKGLTSFLLYICQNNVFILYVYFGDFKSSQTRKNISRHSNNNYPKTIQCIVWQFFLIKIFIKPANLLQGGKKTVLFIT